MRIHCRPAAMGTQKRACLSSPNGAARRSKIHTTTHLLLTAFAIVCITTHVNSRTVIKILKADGWFQVNQKGSHVQFKHPTKPGRVTIVHPKKDIPKGTLKSIGEQSGLKF